VQSVRRARLIARRLDAAHLNGIGRGGTSSRRVRTRSARVQSENERAWGGNNDRDNLAMTFRRNTSTIIKDAAITAGPCYLPATQSDTDRLTARTSSPGDHGPGALGAARARVLHGLTVPARVSRRRVRHAPRLVESLGYDGGQGRARRVDSGGHRAVGVEDSSSGGSARTASAGAGRLASRITGWLATRERRLGGRIWR